MKASFNTSNVLEQWTLPTSQTESIFEEVAGCLDKSLRSGRENFRHSERDVGDANAGFSSRVDLGSEAMDEWQDIESVVSCDV